ncbi:unnamed protein product, partial [marine sediment metagenome]
DSYWEERIEEHRNITFQEYDKRSKTTFEPTQGKKAK